MLLEALRSFVSDEILLSNVDKAHMIAALGASRPAAAAAAAISELGGVAAGERWSAAGVEGRVPAGCCPCWGVLPCPAMLSGVPAFTRHAPSQPVHTSRHISRACGQESFYAHHCRSHMCTDSRRVFSHHTTKALGFRVTSVVSREDTPPHSRFRPLPPPERWQAVQRRSTFSDGRQRRLGEGGAAEATAGAAAGALLLGRGRRRRQHPTRHTCIPRQPSRVGN